MLLLQYLILLFLVEIIPTCDDEGGKIHFLRLLLFTRPHIDGAVSFLASFISHVANLPDLSLFLNTLPRTLFPAARLLARPDETKPSAVLTTF